MTSSTSRSRARVAHALAALVIAASALAPAQQPGVIRTFTHHQVTTLERGVAAFGPIVSDGGTRIVFALPPAGEGRPRQFASMDFGGGPVAVLDEDPSQDLADITADGSRVYYVVGREIRSVNADGSDRRTLLSAYDGNFDCVRVSGNGRAVVFLSARGFVLKNGDQYPQFIRGVYTMEPDGSDLRLVAGPEEVGKLRNIPPDLAGQYNFTISYRAYAIDVSTGGSRVIFGCWAKDVNVLFGCNRNGSGLHAITEFPAMPGTQPQELIAIALSGDGTSAAYQTSYPAQIGVAPFDGGSRRALLTQGDPQDRRFGWGSSVPIFITLDGARLTYQGRQFPTDGGEAFQLLSAHQEGLLRYYEYEMMWPDGKGARFAYFPYEPRPAQLATMEINVPFERRGEAPRIPQIVVDPPSIPREIPNSEFARHLLAARVEASPGPPKVSSTAFYKGLQDEKAMQFGLVGQTDLLDDGQSAESGDRQAGDGLYSRRWLAVYVDAPDGPRTLRVEAQIAAADSRRHASVVEIGPYPIVPGSKERPPAGSTPPIDGTPPPPVSVNPRDPGGETAGGSGTGTGSGGGTGTGTGTGGGTGTSSGTGTGTGAGPGGGTGTGAGGAIDLTGYWVSESGALHFVRQIGSSVYWSVDALPKVRNIFIGTISGSVLTGSWVDLPGGAIETGTGTLEIKIESNDRLTKISDSSPYDASVWVRVAGPPGAGGGAGPGGTGTAGGAAGGPGSTGATGPAGGTGAGAAEPWRTPEGRALIDRWISVAMSKINAFSGSAAFNARKPWGINKYGLLEGKGLGSAFAPDVFPRYGNDRYWFMWDYWVPAPSGWRYPEWNAAGVPPLRDFVLSGGK